MSVSLGLEGVILLWTLVGPFLSYGIDLELHVVPSLPVALSWFYVVYKRVERD